MFGSWDAFYHSELQALWMLLVPPVLFLGYAAGSGRRRALASGLRDAGFVFTYCVFFAFETMVDPLATGPLGRWLELPAPAHTGIQFLFVLLGDFRVFLLVVRLAGFDGALLRALAWTLLVPAASGAIHFGVVSALWPGVPDQGLWLVYEIAFAGLALWLRAARVPRWTRDDPGGHGRMLRRALAYVATYYALWAAADVLILMGIDLGWGLRTIPNQLYYAFWIPFVYLSFFRRSAGEPGGASTRGSRFARFMASK